LIDYNQQGDVAVLAMDDGKANALSHGLVDALNDGLDRAGRDAKGVVVTGRPGMFSGGFDLKELQKGPEAAQALVNKGAHLLLRIYSHPQPVVIACSGHAIAAGAFMLLAADTRVGCEGEFKIGLNETAIGMTLPVFGIELARSRLSKRYQTAAVIQAQLFDPVGARDVGFLDEVVPADTLIDRALQRANALTQLPADAYAATKLAIREPSIAAIRTSLKPA
jgi:enoyl-CoA hydratase